MPQEYIIEVSDKLNSWTSGGRRYRPGIYRTSDTSLVQAAQRAIFGVTVTEAKSRKLDKETDDSKTADEASQEAAFPQGVETTSGALSTADMKGGNAVHYPCRRKSCKELPPFNSKTALRAHNKELHPRSGK